MGTLYGYDLVEDAPGAMRYRDQAMAANTAWWQRHTGGRVFLLAHNTHVSGETSAPETCPKTQGAFLRDRFGARYVNLGFTFGQGLFNAVDPQDPDLVYRPVRLGRSAPDTGERTLERVARGDYYLDYPYTRAALRAARAWLTADHRSATSAPRGRPPSTRPRGWAVATTSCSTSTGSPRPTCADHARQPAPARRPGPRARTADHHPRSPRPTGRHQEVPP